jgi:hypothetical protein
MDSSMHSICMASGQHLDSICFGVDAILDVRFSYFQSKRGLFLVKSGFGLPDPLILKTMENME